MSWKVSSYRPGQDSTCFNETMGFHFIFLCTFSFNLCLNLESRNFPSKEFVSHITRCPSLFPCHVIPVPFPISRDACPVSHITCCLSRFPCHVIPAPFPMSRDACPASHVTWCLSRSPCHVIPAPFRMSRDACPVSHVTWCLSRFPRHVVPVPSI
jgi:hypothetical protein